MELACSKSGSRVLDKLWSVASLKHKQLIGEELYKHEHRLRGDHFGRYSRTDTSGRPITNVKIKNGTFRTMAIEGIDRGLEETPKNMLCTVCLGVTPWGGGASTRRKLPCSLRQCVTKASGLLCHSAFHLSVNCNENQTPLLLVHFCALLTTASTITHLPCCDWLTRFVSL